jgi:hypothetical protein
MDEMPSSSISIYSSSSNSNSNAADELISTLSEIITNNGDLSFFPFPSSTPTTTLAQSPSEVISQAELAEMADEQPILDTWRVPPSLFAVFVIFYAAVFFCGLVGNTFVVAAIVMNKSLRTATDWLISSLAVSLLNYGD